MNWKDLHIDKSWSLFLDRDGVINKKIDDDYVRSIDQFEWLPGAREAISKLSAHFGKTIIITNQQGVGKGLMTGEAVEHIHSHIISSIRDSGGKIDAVYYAPHLKSDNSALRKPNTGMALLAKQDFPDIEFVKSVVVGDSISDMEFGRRAGMKTAFILNGKSAPAVNPLIDDCFNDLPSFAECVLQGK